MYDTEGVMKILHFRMVVGVDEMRTSVTDGTIRNSYGSYDDRVPET